jgi:hypothetical protein
VSGWTTIPVAFSVGDGTFKTVNKPDSTTMPPSFAAQASGMGVKFVTW